MSTLLTLNDLEMQNRILLFLTRNNYAVRRLGIVVVCRPSVRLYVTDTVLITNKTSHIAF